MRFAVTTFLAATLLASGVSFVAAEATDPNVIARQGVMTTIGKNAKALGEMASGKTPYDAAGAEAAKAALVEAAGQIPVVFEANATDDDSEAKPEIWANWDDFAKDGAALKTAAEALDVASAESIGAGMAVVGGACKDCHTDYRVQK